MDIRDVEVIVDGELHSKQKQLKISINNLKMKKYMNM